MDIARGNRLPAFGCRASDLVAYKPAHNASPAPYYVRMKLKDQPGALAKVATVLGNAGVSIDRMRQYRHQDPAAPVLIVTHKTSPVALAEALAELPNTGVVIGEPVAIRIEEV